MKTELFRVDPRRIDPEIVTYCGRKLRQGALVCFPTETVYGLGANAFDAQAIDRIYEAKQRPADNPLIVHISNMDMLDGITCCAGQRRSRLLALGKIFWPGPLTLIVDRGDAIPPNVSCGLASVGIRFPRHPVAQALIQAAGVPVAAPSANLSGRPSPTLAEHVIEDLDGRVDIILDGGPCEVGVESTVFDLIGQPPTILRPGAVTLPQLQSVIGSAAEFCWKGQATGGDPSAAGQDSGNDLAEEVEKPRSPGMKYTHYAPKAKVTIYSGPQESVVRRIRKELEQAEKTGIFAGVLATEQTICYYNKDVPVLSFGDGNNGLEQASRLYACLRQFDELGVSVVLAEAVPSTGVGNAVMNRLYRAAGGRLVETGEYGEQKEGGREP